MQMQRITQNHCLKLILSIALCFALAGIDSAFAKSRKRKPTAREVYLHRSRMIDRAALGVHGYSYVYRGVRYYRTDVEDLKTGGKSADRPKKRGGILRAKPIAPDGVVGLTNVRPYWYPWHENRNRSVTDDSDYYGSEFFTTYPVPRNRIQYFSPDSDYFDQPIMDSTAYSAIDNLLSATRHAVVYEQAKIPYILADRPSLPDPLLDSVPQLYNPGRRFLASPEKPVPESPRKKKKLNYTLSERASSIRFRYHED